MIKKSEYADKINEILNLFFGEQYKIDDIMKLNKRSIINLYEALEILRQKRMTDYFGVKNG